MPSICRFRRAARSRGRSLADISRNASHDVDNRTPQMFLARLRDWQSRGGASWRWRRREFSRAILLPRCWGKYASATAAVSREHLASAAGLYQRLSQSYIRDGRSGARERERLAQSVLGGPKINTQVVGRAQVIGSACGSACGSPTASDRVANVKGRNSGCLPEVENLEIPIRFMDGAVFLGSTGLKDTALLSAVPASEFDLSRSTLRPEAAQEAGRNPS